MSFFISDALAQAAPAAPQQPSLIASLLPFILLFVIFYFLIIRPQTKRAKEHRKMVAELARGDEVITSGGLLGRIDDLSDDYVTLELAQGVQVKLQRQSVAAIVPKGTLKST